MKIAVLQPLIPEYRETFLKTLAQSFNLDFFVYFDSNALKKQQMGKSTIQVKKVTYFNILKIVGIYSFIPFLKKEYEILILPGEIRNISNWILLFLKPLHKKKIILWGHGISIKRYLVEEKKYPISKRLFHKLADMVWLYTEKEKNILSKYINPNKMISLNNTIDNRYIFLLNISIKQKNELKLKYSITQNTILIFCARFNTPYRRTDLLLKIINNLDDQKFGFIIIGEGKYKPDFSPYSNVYDFNSVYDPEIKKELFTIADLYIQPAWLGLSVAEALSYGKPILTFHRTPSIKQCVEYFYVLNGENGYIADSTQDIIEYILNLSSHQINTLQNNALLFAKTHLHIDNMIQRASFQIKSLLKSQ